MIVKPAPTHHQTLFMKYNPNIHHRRSIRLKGYDYSQPGAYFITICTHQRECLFGEIIDGQMHLKNFGRIIQIHWGNLQKHHLHIKLDEFVIMPNHLHGIIILFNDSVGAGLNDTFRSQTEQMTIKPAPATIDELINYQQKVGAGLNDTFRSQTEQMTIKPAPATIVQSTNYQQKGIPEIIRGFKTFSARQINNIRSQKGVPLWQRNYYEHIIRNESDLNRIREYIVKNPQKWKLVSIGSTDHNTTTC